MSDKLYNHKTMETSIDDQIKVYENLKSLAEKISKLPSDTHYYIFEILKKNKIHYSMNNNGVFINFENIPTNVVSNIEDVIEINHNRTINGQEEINQTELIQKENINLVNENENIKMNNINKISSLSIYDECKKTIEDTCGNDSVKNNLQQIWNNFEKDKQSSRKSSVNTFANAKKKYGRQIISDYKIVAPFLEKES